MHAYKLLDLILNIEITPKKCLKIVLKVNAIIVITVSYNSLWNGCVGCISKVENWAVVRTFWPRFRLLFKQDGYSILSVTFRHHVFVVYPLKVFLKNVYLSDSKWISIMYTITGDTSTDCLKLFSLYNFWIHS